MLLSFLQQAEAPYSFRQVPLTSAWLMYYLEAPPGAMKRDSALLYCNVQEEAHCYTLQATQIVVYKRLYLLNSLVPLFSFLPVLEGIRKGCHVGFLLSYRRCVIC